MRASADRRQGTNVSPIWSRARCAKILGQEDIKPHKVRYYLERRDAEFEQKMAQVLCVYREVQVLKKAAAKSNKSAKAAAVVSYDEKPGIQAIATTAPDLPPVPSVHATFARDHEYKRHGTLSLLAGVDLLTGKVHALVRDRHRSREFIEFLKLLDAAYPASTAIKLILDKSFRTHLEGNQSLARHTTGGPLRLYVHGPSTAPGSTSSRASSPSLLVPFCVTSAWHQNTNSRNALWLASTTSIAIQSSTPGPISLPRLPDMIQTMETLT